MLLMLKLDMVTRVILLLILFTSFSFAECKNYKDIDHIKLEINNSQKFFTRAARYYIAVNSKGTKKAENVPRYQKTYKRKVRSNVSFVMKDGTSCKFKSTLRGHGDLKSHFSLINGVPISSYRIKLEEGNFNNITRFILLRPKSRYYNNEVFTTTLLKELGFLVPRTFNVKVKVNNVTTNFIFQENIKKEFLENNNRVEGPLLEANEDLTKFNKLSLARISNKEWIKGINQNYVISLNAIKNFNLHRFHGYSFRIKSADYKDSIGLAADEILRLDRNNLEPREYKNIGMFQAAMWAIGASHGLSYDDARFYYDPLYSILEPIYYDGDVKILTAINYDPHLGVYKKKIENWKKVKDININFENYEEKSFKENLRNQVVSKLAKDNALHVSEKLNKLDKTNLLGKLKDNGFENINLSQLDYLLQFIDKRLEIISKSNVQENLTFQTNIFKTFAKEMDIEKDLQLIFFENFHMSKENKLNVQICDYRLLVCKKAEINEENLIQLVEQNDINKKNNSFLVMKKEEYQNGTNKKSIEELDENFEKVIFSDDIKFIKNQSVKININPELKEIILDYNTKKGRLIFLESNLDSWKISMNNKTNEDKNNNLFTKKITGCLTIIDSEIKNLEFQANNFFCEDTLNIIRTTGSVDKINITNSFSDALDLDFSNISISKLEISNSGNDCADFSFGNYEIKHAKIDTCGDKAISVGEKSILNIENLNAENSIIGLASKDSSRVKLQNVYINNVETCLAAYNKKQEFFGGRIEVKNKKCENYLNFVEVDKISEVFLDGKLINEL